MHDLSAETAASVGRRSHPPHIAADATASVTNGLSLCTSHHRAYDQDLVGIDADYKVHVARRLLEDDDVPMLELLKTFHGGRIGLPHRGR